MTEQEWTDILTCSLAAQNSDSTSVYEAGVRLHEWITTQDWDD